MKINYNNLELNIKTQEYVEGRRLAVSLETADGEPYVVLTKNFPDYEYVSEGEAFVDGNNVPADLIEKLEDEGVMRGTGIFTASGFCVYELYQFNLDLLNV